MNGTNYIVVFLVAAVIDLIMPIIVFGVGFVGGIILQGTFGSTLTSGLNLLFNTSRFTPDVIPIFCGTLAVIGGYFKSISAARKE